MLPFLKYKEKEAELQAAFGSVPIVVESISATDLYYTDGAAAIYAFKVTIDSIITVYAPQFPYNVNPEHKKLIKEWIDKVEGLNSPQ
jgi:hypothetical protein